MSGLRSLFVPSWKIYKINWNCSQKRDYATVTSGKSVKTINNGRVKHEKSFDFLAMHSVGIIHYRL